METFDATLIVVPVLKIRIRKRIFSAEVTFIFPQVFLFTLREMDTL